MREDETERSAKLEVVRPDGVQFDLPLIGSSVTLGRDASADVVLDTAYVSRLHARVERVPGGYNIVDVGSRNGTFVNGERVAGAQLLVDGDQIEIGSITARFVDASLRTTDETIVLTRRSPFNCDAATREVWVRGERMDFKLSVQEFQLLNELASRYGRVCSRDDLGAVIWGRGSFEYNMLHRLVMRTKRKLGVDLQHAIVAVPRVGYKMDLGA